MTGKSFKLDGSSQLNVGIESQTASANPSEYPSASPTTSPAEISIKSDLQKLMQDGINFQNEVKINGSFQSPNKLEINLTTDAPNLSGSGLLGLIGAETMVDFSLINDGNDIYVKNNN
jgi:hypothetical protein